MAPRPHSVRRRSPQTFGQFEFGLEIEHDIDFGTAVDQARVVMQAPVADPPVVGLVFQERRLLVNRTEFGQLFCVQQRPHPQERAVFGGRRQRVGVLGASDNAVDNVKVGVWVGHGGGKMKAQRPSYIIRPRQGSVVGGLFAFSVLGRFAVRWGMKKAPPTPSVRSVPERAQAAVVSLLRGQWPRLEGEDDPAFWNHPVTMKGASGDLRRGQWTPWSACAWAGLMGVVVQKGHSGDLWALSPEAKTGLETAWSAYGRRPHHERNAWRETPVARLGTAATVWTMTSLARNAMTTESVKDLTAEGLSPRMAQHLLAAWRVCGSAASGFQKVRQGLLAAHLGWSHLLLESLLRQPVHPRVGAVWSQVPAALERLASGSPGMPVGELVEFVNALAGAVGKGRCLGDAGMRLRWAVGCMRWWPIAVPAQRDTPAALDATGPLLGLAADALTEGAAWPEPLDVPACWTTYEGNDSDLVGDVSVLRAAAFHRQAQNELPNPAAPSASRPRL